MDAGDQQLAYLDDGAAPLTLDCLGTISTACQKIRQTMETEDVDIVVRENINRFAAFSQFAVNLYMPPESAQLVQNIDMVPDPGQSNRAWISDKIDDGTDQHCRDVIAMQLLVLSHVALQKENVPYANGDNTQMVKWTANKCMTIAQADLTQDRFKYDSLVSWKRAVASYASHNVPRQPDSDAVANDQDVQEMCSYGYNCADALRMQAAL
jgi:hypothetical protein